MIENHPHRSLAYFWRKLVGRLARHGSTFSGVGASDKPGAVHGKAARLVWKVTKPRTIGVRAVLLDQDDRIALVRHTYTDAWYLPGGGVKKGESIEAALLRELEEEVAVVGPKIERVLGVYNSQREAKDDHIIIYAARTVSDASSDLPKADLMEIEEARWFPLDQVPASTSAATVRRISEYRSGATGSGAW